MQYGKHLPAASTYKASISTCGEASQWQEAPRLLAELPDYGILPEASTYMACISAGVQASQWQVAGGSDE